MKRADSHARWMPCIPWWRSKPTLSPAQRQARSTSCVFGRRGRSRPGSGQSEPSRLASAGSAAGPHVSAERIGSLSSVPEIESWSRWTSCGPVARSVTHPWRAFRDARIRRTEPGARPRRRGAHSGGWRHSGVPERNSVLARPGSQAHPRSDSGVAPASERVRSFAPRHPLSTRADIQSRLHFGVLPQLAEKRLNDRAQDFRARGVVEERDRC